MAVTRTRTQKQFDAALGLLKKKSKPKLANPIGVRGKKYKIANPVGDRRKNYKKGIKEA